MVSSPLTERAFSVLPLIAALGYGSLGILVTLARMEGLGLAGVLAWRFLLAVVCLTPLAYLSLRRRGVAAVAKALLLAVALGAVAFAGQSFTYLSAVAALGAGKAAVLLYVYPFYVLLLDWGVNGRRPTRAHLGAIGLAFGGCCLTAWSPGGGFSPAGFAYALATGVIYAVYLILSDRLAARLGPVSLAWGVSLGAGLAFAAGALFDPLGFLPGSVRAWSLEAALALAATVLPFIAFFIAMNRLGPARSAVLAMAEPVFAMVLGVLILHEAAGGAQIVGAVFVVAGGILLVASPKASSPPAPPVLTLGE